MQPLHLLLPVFVQVGLTFFLAFWTARERIGALARREVAPSDIALGQKAWPDRPMQVANAYCNQLELPTLFYAAVAFALITSRADVVLLILAWIFVATRLVHAWIHTTSNDIRRRFRAFAFGVLTLLAMWVYFGASLLLAGLV